jgi:hypothetical protein
LKRNLDDFTFPLSRLKSKDFGSQMTWLSYLQTPILIGCNFLMILTALADFLSVRCNQLSLKLYTGFDAVQICFFDFSFVIKRQKARN